MLRGNAVALGTTNIPGLHSVPSAAVSSGRATSTGRSPGAWSGSRAGHSHQPSPWTCQGWRFT